MEYTEDRILDEFLVMRSQDGDVDALALLIGRYQAAFLRYASIMVRDPELARDVVQETWHLV